MLLSFFFFFTVKILKKKKKKNFSYRVLVLVWAVSNNLWTLFVIITCSSVVLFLFSIGGPQGLPVNQINGAVYRWMPAYRNTVLSYLYKMWFLSQIQQFPVTDSSIHPFCRVVTEVLITVLCFHLSREITDHLSSVVEICEEVMLIQNLGLLLDVK